MAERAPDASDNGGGFGAVDVVADDRELVATGSADDQLVAGRRVEAVGHRDEGRVAGFVAVGVVDEREVVEVE